MAVLAAKRSRPSDAAHRGRRAPTTAAAIFSAAAGLWSCSSPALPSRSRAALSEPCWLITSGTSLRDSFCRTRRLAYDASHLMQDAVWEAESYRTLKQRQLRDAARTWNRHGQNWTVEPVLDANGDEFIPDLKHGTNILLNGVYEFPPWAQLQAEHADRGLLWVEKKSINDIWAHHCNVAYVSSQWRPVLDPLERIIDKVEHAFAALTHVKDVINPSTKFRKAWELAARHRWTIHRRLRRCDRFSRAFMKLLTIRDDATEAQRRAAAQQMILFEQDGINIQHNGVYRDDPVAFLELQKVRGAMFNISLKWDKNIEQDKQQKAYLIRNKQELEGVPDRVLEDAAQQALVDGYKASAQHGPWVLSVDDAVVEPILRHAKGRTLREMMYGSRARIAYQGGQTSDDNGALVTQMLRIRKRFANVIGYASHSDVVFSRTMANPKQANGFLLRLRKESLPVARHELRELQAFAKSRGVDHEIDFFDVDYWQERLLEERYGLREEYIRQFFPLPAVLEGLFGLLRRLFGVQVVEEETELAWAKHVRFFRIREESSGELVASFFLDAHRRLGQKKRGFWASPIQGYSELLGTVKSGPRRPAVHIMCDLEPPGEDGLPALLTHREVAKLYRVMGTALRELFCKQEEGLLAGTAGLELDAIALPAHFLERWAYEESTVASMSRHVETGDPLPQAAISAIAGSRTFHSGLRVLRRAATAQIDFELHSEFDPDGELSVYDVSKLIEAEFTVIRPRVEDHELCSWPINTELGGVMYGDLWAEALAADAFAQFEAAGLHDKESVSQLGQRFRRCILEPGGGRAPGSACEEFAQRMPSFNNFLVQSGLAEGAAKAEAAAAQNEGDDNMDEYVVEDPEDLEEYDEDDDYAEFEEDAGIYRPGQRPSESPGGSASGPR